MRHHQLGSHAHYKIHGSIHGRQIEIEIAGPFRCVPALCARRRLGVLEVQCRKIVRAGHRHPIKGTGPNHVQMLALHPKKSCAKRTQEPFVARAHQKVRAQLIHVHRHGSAALADIEQQQRSLFAASGCNARRIEKRAIVKTHHAHGNQAGFWRHRRNQIVGGNKSFPGRDNFQFQSLAFFHRFPRRVLQRKFALRGDDLIARLPRQPIRDCHRARARSAGQRNFFSFSSNQFRNRRANAVGHFEKRGVWFLVRIFLSLKRRLHGANGNLRHRRLARQIQIRRVFDFEPFLPPVGPRNCCRRGHGHSSARVTRT